MLTEAAVRKAKPSERDYKLSDSGGLHLFVSKSGHRSWRLKYRHGGKERRLVFGSYPEVSLASARQMRDDAKRLLREGRDPAYERKKQKLANVARHEHTFERYAREWHALQKATWTSVHSEDVLLSLEKNVFPAIGSMAITDIDEAMVLAVLRSVQKRGAIETSHRLRQRMSSIFKFAKPTAKNGNPTDVSESLQSVPAGRRWPALTDLQDIKALIAAADRAGANPITRLASRFMALTAQRPGMIRTAPWSEFEGIDWEDSNSSAEHATWCIPAERMKQSLEMREDEAFEHRVPLSTHAVSVLRAVRQLTGNSPLVFPNNRSALAPLSENAVGYLYNRLGFKRRHVAHGWRSSFSTLMNEHFAKLYVGQDPRLIIERLIVDLMLAHTPAGMSATELRYNRAAYMDRRRELGQLWGDWIMAGQLAARELISGPRRPLSRTR